MEGEFAVQSAAREAMRAQRVAEFEVMRNTVFGTDKAVRLSIERLKTGDAEEILQHPGPNDAARDQWVSRGDGRIIGMDRDGGFTASSGRNA